MVGWIFPVALGLRAGSRWLSTVGMPTSTDAYRADGEG